MWRIQFALRWVRNGFRTAGVRRAWEFGLHAWKFNPPEFTHGRKYYPCLSIALNGIALWADGKSLGECVGSRENGSYVAWYERWRPVRKSWFKGVKFVDVRSARLQLLIFGPRSGAER